MLPYLREYLIWCQKISEFTSLCTQSLCPLGLCKVARGTLFCGETEKLPPLDCFPPLLLLALLLLLADFLCLTEGIHHSFLPPAPPLLFPSSHGYIYHPQPILAWSQHRNMLLCCNTSVTPRSPQDESISMYRLKNCLQSPNSMKGKQLNPTNYFWTILYS